MYFYKYPYEYLYIDNRHNDNELDTIDGDISNSNDHHNET